ncbi:hypothetical protein V6N12_055567 [Hibiscus sabdariffa]|uniref:Rad4 beta-hairpin domain-containing protein n=1 Tax=Hibiscus sabdariffa TaxID=183260 RepID=A0ABR2BVG3_9ROSI
MVGFEFRNGHATPIFDGIVVCTKFKDAILEAYAEEEEKRTTEENKRNEVQTISGCNVLFPQSHFTFPFKSLKTPSLLPLVNPVQAFIIGSRRRLSSLLRFVTTRRSRLATTGSPLEKHGYGESITSSTPSHPDYTLFFTRRPPESSTLTRGKCGKSEGLTMVKAKHQNNRKAKRKIVDYDNILQSPDMDNF